MINAERGEAVINANSMSNPFLRNLASSINQAGGGVSFSTGTSTELKAVISDDVIDKIVAKVVAIPVVVTESDITRTQRRVSVIETKTRY